MRSDTPPLSEVDLNSLLSTGFGVVHDAVEPAADGAEGASWKVTLATGKRCHLKIYHAGSNWRKIVWRAEIGNALHEHGLPFARVLPTMRNELALSVAGRVAQLSTWLDGAHAESFDASTGAAVGEALALVHRALGERFRTTAEDCIQGWRSTSAADALLQCQRLIRELEYSTEAAELDGSVYRALCERTTYLQAVDEIRTALPPEACQLVHFDFTRPNLLLDGRRVSGVVDLKGEAGDRLWEVAKLAFEPRTVAQKSDWLTTARYVAAAYGEAWSSCRGISGCVRISILYNLLSFWGPWQRYVERLPDTDWMVAYWLDRHEAARRLLSCMQAAEQALSDL